MNRKETIDKLARTLWGEARGEGPEGMQAVANVIMNRHSSPVTWWGISVLDILFAPMQFSMWNEDDPNRAKAMAITETDPQFKLAMDIATAAIDGDLEDITGGADHYHTTRITPYWADSSKATAVIGLHKFYKLEA